MVRLGDSKLQVRTLTDHMVSFLTLPSLGFPIGRIQVMPATEICGENETMRHKKVLITVLVT